MEVIWFFFIIICFVLLYFYLNWYSNKRYRYRKFANLYGWSDEDDKTIMKRFEEKPELIKEAEKFLEEKKDSEHRWKEAQRKQMIKERMFAYEYEELLYQIFAPYAKLNYEGKWDYLGSLPMELIIERISDIKNISIEDAEDIFGILIKHNLIHRFIPNEGYEYGLSPLLLPHTSKKADEQGIYSRWDIVSDTDLNLDKWMVANGYEHKY